MKTKEIELIECVTRCPYIKINWAGFASMMRCTPADVEGWLNVTCTKSNCHVCRQVTFPPTYTTETATSEEQTEIIDKREEYVLEACDVEDAEDTSYPAKKKKK